MSVQFPKKPSSTNATAPVAQPKTTKPGTPAATRHTGVADGHEDAHVKAPDALGNKPQTAALQPPRANVKGRVGMPPAPPAAKADASDGAGDVLGQYETAPEDRQQGALGVLNEFNRMMQDAVG